VNVVAKLDGLAGRGKQRRKMGCVEERLRRGGHSGCDASVGKESAGKESAREKSAEKREGRPDGGAEEESCSAREAAVATPMSVHVHTHSMGCL
jgi:hypothetical protein